MYRKNNLDLLKRLIPDLANCNLDQAITIEGGNILLSLSYVDHSIITCTDKDTILVFDIDKDELSIQDIVKLIMPPISYKEILEKYDFTLTHGLCYNSNSSITIDPKIMEVFMIDHKNNDEGYSWYYSDELELEMLLSLII